jgi:hypothetical protein
MARAAIKTKSQKRRPPAGLKAYAREQAAMKDYVELLNRPPAPADPGVRRRGD